jgi:hypothetical protein
MARLVLMSSWQAGESCEAGGGVGRGLGNGTTSAAALPTEANSMISGRTAFTPAFWLE